MSDLRTVLAAQLVQCRGGLEQELQLVIPVHVPPVGKKLYCYHYRHHHQQQHHQHHHHHHHGRSY